MTNVSGFKSFLEKQCKFANPARILLGLVEVLNINCNMQAIKMKIFGIRSHTYGPFKTILLVWQLLCSLNDAQPTFICACKMLWQSWHFLKNLWKRIWWRNTDPIWQKLWKPTSFAWFLLQILDDISALCSVFRLAAARCTNLEADFSKQPWARLCKRNVSGVRGRDTFCADKQLLWVAKLIHLLLWQCHCLTWLLSEALRLSRG